MSKKAKIRELESEVADLEWELDVARRHRDIYGKFSSEVQSELIDLQDAYHARGKTIHELTEKFREKKERIHAFYAPQLENRKKENEELDQVKKCLDLVIGQKIRLAEYLEEMECQLEDMKEDVSFYRRKWLESVKPDDGMAGTTDEAEYLLKLLADALKSIAAAAGEVEWILQKEAS